MKDEIEFPSIMEYSARFGIKALDMGFVTIDQVLEALSEQVLDDYIRKPHRRLGRILSEKGLITPEQIKMVLKGLAEESEKKMNSDRCLT